MIRGMLPLSVRKRLCILITSQKWVDSDLRYWWTIELLRDYREKDINAYHQFLWRNHLGYALSYEKDVRFGKEQMVKSRVMFFSDLRDHLNRIGINPSSDVRSVLEVGCSLGYQLQFLETDLFHAATELEGTEERLYIGVIITNATSAHTRGNAIFS